MNNVLMVIITGVIFWLGGFATGASAGAYAVKRNIGRVLDDYSSFSDEISVQYVLDIVEEA